MRKAGGAHGITGVLPLVMVHKVRLYDFNKQSQFTNVDTHIVKHGSESGVM
jgi:hypothetical protein